MKPAAWPWWPSQEQGWLRLAIAAWAVIFVVVSARVLLSKPRSHSDYLTFANPARNWLAGRGLYLQQDATGYCDDFRYSPLVAVALVPFAVLPDQTGETVWRLFNLGVFLGALLWWARKAAAPIPTTMHLALLALLVLPLSAGNINNGQSNPLMLGLLLAAIACSTQQRWNLAALLLALACLFKLYPLAVALLLVAVYPRQLGWRLVVALLAGLLLPFLLQHPRYVWQQYDVWFRYLVHEDRQCLPVTATYRDLRLLWRAWIGPLPARVYPALQLLTAAGSAALCWFGHGAGWPARRVLPLLTGLGCVWMTVFGVATESCTYMLVAPTAAWALLQAWLERRGLVVKALLAGSYGLFLSAQIANWFHGGNDFHALGVQPLAGLLLLGGLLAAEVRRPAATANAEDETPKLAKAADGRLERRIYKRALDRRIIEA
jgi:hypothetical protein